MANNVITYSRLWEPIQEEICCHVQQSSGVAAAYVQGPAGTGKSTTMLQFLVAKFADQFKDPRVMYMHPSRIHGLMMEEYLSALDPENGSLGKLPSSQTVREIRENKRFTISTYEDFFKEWLKNKEQTLMTLPTINFWDLEILATRDGELAMTALMQSIMDAHAAGPSQRSAVFMLAEHWSQRTYDVLQQRCGPSVERFAFEAARPEPGWTVQDSTEEGTRGWIPADCPADGSLVIRGGACSEIVGTFKHPEDTPVAGPEVIRVSDKFVGLDELRGNLKAQLWYAVVRHNISWSSSLRGLGTLYSAAHLTGVVLDTITGQQTVRSRKLTQAELTRLHSWAIKSMF